MPRSKSLKRKIRRSKKAAFGAVEHNPTHDKRAEQMRLVNPDHKEAGMRINQKGEIATATLIVVAAVFLIGTLIPEINPLNLLRGKSGPDASKQTATWTRQNEIIEPTLLQSNTGDPVAVGNKITRTYDTGTEEKPVKPTLGQTIGRFFAGLTFWGVILVFALPVSALAGLFALLVKKYLVIKQAFKGTIQAIREADEETYSKLKPRLEKNHDRRDRKVVDKIKAELQ